MAKITDGTFTNWEDTQTIHAADYNQEREILRIAVNDNDERLSSLETSTAGLQLGTAQLQKITDDDGGVKISVNSSAGDILAELVNEGEGFHTFYAVSGSKNLPPSNISIRGFAHMTSATIGYAIAIDYKGGAFINYYDGSSAKWIGWKTIGTDALAQMTKITYDDGSNLLDAGLVTDDILKMITDRGIGFSTFYARSGSKNLPDPSLPIRGISHLTSPTNGYIMAVDTLGGIHTNAYGGGTWQGWKNNNPSPTALWSSTNGIYLLDTQTVTPSKKLSDCNGGWVLVWSDFDSPATGNNYNWNTTMVPKFMGLNHSGANWSLAISVGSSLGELDKIASKELTIYNDKIIGNAQNSLALSSDVVLRYVLEY